MVCAPPSHLRCPQEMTTLRAAQETAVEFEFRLKRQNGDYLDLRDVEVPIPPESSDGESSEAGDFEVELLARETYTSALIVLCVEGEVVDEAEGLVRFVLEEEDSQYPGVYVGEVLVKKGGTRVHSMPVYIEFAPSQSATMQELSPALSIPWIRLMLRDTCAEANYLLDELEFSDTEIAFALRHPIDEWNETPPPVGVYTPRTFPFRNYHARAAIAELLMIAGHWYLRNHLSYSAAGVSVNDRDKGNAYITLANKYQQEWRQWMKNMKIQQNIEGGFTSLQSPYTLIDAYYGFYGA